jgi:hypothetical protein
MRVLSSLVWALLAGAAWGQIEMPDEVQLGEPIVCTVKLEGVPEGAEWKQAVVPDITGDCRVEPGPAPNVFHLWGLPGEYTVEVFGMWGVRDSEKPTSWSDFGFVKDKRQFRIVGKVVPPDPPLPPTPDPSGPYQIMYFVTADQRDNLPKEQRALFTSLVERQWLRDQGHVLLEVLDPTRIDPGSVPGHYRAWFQAVQGKTLPAVGIAPKEGGDVVIHPLPSDSSKFRELLAASGKRVR